MRSPFHVRAPQPEIDWRSGLTAWPLAPRNKALFILSRYLIDVEGERFPVSAPRAGDATRNGGSWRMTLGVAAADVARLGELAGQTARLCERDGKELLSFRIDRVDARFALLSSEPRRSH